MPPGMRWPKGQATSPVTLNKGGGGEWLRTRRVPPRIPTVPTRVQHPQKGCRKGVARGHLSQSGTPGHQDVTRRAVSRCFWGEPTPTRWCQQPTLAVPQQREGGVGGWVTAEGTATPAAASPTPAPQKPLPEVGWEKGAEGLDPLKRFLPPSF